MKPCEWKFAFGIVLPSLQQLPNPDSSMRPVYTTLGYTRVGVHHNLNSLMQLARERFFDTWRLKVKMSWLSQGKILLGTAVSVVFSGESRCLQRSQFYGGKSAEPRVLQSRGSQRNYHFLLVPRAVPEPLFLRVILVLRAFRAVLRIVLPYLSIRPTS